MTDTIRKAVELVDGWEIEAEKDGRTWIMGSVFSGTIGAMKQPHLDALAAQLVRQALAKGFDIHIDIQGTHFEAPGMWIEITDMKLSSSQRFESDARFCIANNYIKAIVDSKVLDDN